MQPNAESLSLDAQPPMTVPLWHFLVGLPFLVGGGGLALSVGLGRAGATEQLVAAHLLLVGWVCLTILGAMTQFVPVWSGQELHVRRLANLQLALVAVGVVGFVASLWVGRSAATALFALAMLAGFLTFVYNLGRTLLPARPWDVTEGHFAFALACFALATPLGAALALDYRFGLLSAGAIPRTNVLGAHVTLAVFGGVISTVAGALYQLGPMFAQSEPTAFDRRLRQLESAALPTGVLLLAGGRLLGHAAAATVGGLLVALGVLAVGVFLTRRLIDATAGSSPMLSRYAIVAAAAIGWATTAPLAWVGDPLGSLFGLPGVGTLLLFVVIGFVVVGTLYHVVPFIIWVHRYSDRIGLEPVPMIDDLYDGRVETVDLALSVVGTALVISGTVTPTGSTSVTMIALGGGALVMGITLFAGNLVSTVLAHAPDVVRLRRARIDDG